MAGLLASPALSAPLPRQHAAPPQPTRTLAELGVTLLHLTDDPLGVIRTGLALQLTGFAVLVIVR